MRHCHHICRSMQKTKNIIHVFCYELTITILGKEHNCPAFVFVLHSNVSLPCDSIIYEADAKTLASTEMLLSY